MPRKVFFEGKRFMEIVRMCAQRNLRKGVDGKFRLWLHEKGGRPWVEWCSGSVMEMNFLSRHVGCGWSARG